MPGVRDIMEKAFSTGVLRLLSPTDCVKDRLAAYYRWNDRQSLQQAILVARMCDINLDEIERWSIKGVSRHTGSIAQIVGHLMSLLLLYVHPLLCPTTGMEVNVLFLSDPIEITVAEAHRNRTCPGRSSHPTPDLKSGGPTRTHPLPPESLAQFLPADQCVSFHYRRENLP